MSLSASAKVEFNASSFNAQARSMAESIKTVQKELKASDAALQKNGTKIEQLENKYKGLGNQLQLQEQLTEKYAQAVKMTGEAQQQAKVKLDAANKALAEGKQQYGENSKEVQKLERAVLKKADALARATTTHEKYKGKLADSKAAEEILRASVDETGKSLDKQKRYIAQVNEAYTAMHAKTATVQKGLTASGKALTLGVTTPLVAAGVQVVRLSTQFNEALANIGTLNIDTSRLQTLKKGIQEVAVTVAKAPTDIADGVYQVISAYGDSEDTLKIVEINAKAAAAGLSTTTDAINLTSAVTKGYGEVSAEASQKASDLAFETVRLGQTTFPELAASMGKVVPSANAMKVSQEELFGVFATLTGVTGNASEVSTQFGAVLKALMKPSTQMTAALNSMGFESGFAAVEALGLQGVLQKLTEITGGSEEAMVNLAGEKEAVTAMLALTGAQADTFREKLEELKDAAGATDAAFAAQSEGVNETGFAFQQAMVKMQVAAQRFGDAAAPMIEKGADAISDLSGWLSTLDEDGMNRLLNIGIKLAALGPILTTASKALTVGQWAKAGIKTFKNISEGAETGTEGVAALAKGLEGVSTAAEGGAKVTKMLGSILKMIPGWGKAATVAVVAIGAAVAVGKKAYDSWYDSQYRWSKGLSEGNEQIRESMESLKELDSLKKDLDAAKLVIENPESSKEALEEAETKLESISQYLEKKYGLKVSTDVTELDKTLEELEEFEVSNVNAKMTTQSNRLEELQPDFDNYQKEAASLKETINLYSKKAIMAENAQNKINALSKDSATYTEDATAILKEAGLWDGYSPLESLIDGLSSDVEDYRGVATDANDKLKELTASYEEYVAVSTEMANWDTELIERAAAEGDASEVAMRLEHMSSLIKGAELDLHGYAIAAAEAMNGQGSLDKAWKEGGETLDAVVNDYIRASTEFGASTQSTAVGAALLSEGFKSIEEAADEEGGMERVNQKANELAKTIEGFPENTSIQIEADGDISLIDDVSGKVKAIQTAEGVTVRVDAEGNVETLDKAGNQVSYLEGVGAVSVRVNAETGNLEALNEAGEVVATIENDPNKNIKIDVTANTEGAKATITDLNNEKVEVPVNANTEPAKTTIEGLNGTTVFVNVKANPLQLAGGTSDFDGGLAMINDQKGVSDPRELVEVNGKGYLFDGRDVVLPLPEHAKVFTASQTKQMMAGMGIPHYASGKNNTSFEQAKSAFQHRQKTSEVSVLEQLEWWQSLKNMIRLTAEEAEEVEEEIYSLTQTLNEESIKDYETRINNQIEDGERWLNQQVKLYNISYDEQIEILNRIDKRHLETLDEMVANTKMTEEEKDEIYREYYQAHEDRIIEIAELEKKKAEEVKEALDAAYEARFADSQEWTSDRNFYNDWADYGDDPISAYNRVKAYTNEQIAAETDPEKIKKLQEQLAKFGSDMYEQRREDSERWMETEEYYGEMTVQKRLDGINRQRKYTQQYYEAGMISHREYVEAMDELDKEYFSALKERLEEETTEYYDAQKEKLNAKKEAIEKEYALLEEQETSADREAELQELQKQEDLFAGAVTLEGKQRLKEIQEQIAALEDEALAEQREKEKDARLEAVDEEIDALEKEEEAALAGVSEYAKKMTSIMGESNTKATQAFTNLMEEYSRQQQSIAEAGVTNLSNLVTETNRMLREIKIAEKDAKQAAKQMETYQRRIASASGTVNTYNYKQIINNSVTDVTHGLALGMAASRAFLLTGKTR